MNPDNLKVSDGVVLINIMKNKSNELNKIFECNDWNPRSIDKILWATRDGIITTNNTITNNYYSNHIDSSYKGINIKKYIVNNKITSKDKKEIKSLFISYLIEYHPYINTVDTYFTDAIFILNNKDSLNLDFLDTLFKDDNFSIYNEKLINHFIGKGWNIEKSKQQAKIYIRAISLFKDFVENTVI
jgi:hypothetical protein